MALETAYCTVNHHLHDLLALELRDRRCIDSPLPLQLHVGHLGKSSRSRPHVQARWRRPHLQGEGAALVTREWLANGEEKVTA